MISAPVADWLLDRSTDRLSTGGIFWHAPSTVFQAPGGGENQLVQTGMELEEQGISVRLFSPWVDRIDQARLIHLFGMSREGLEVARVARAHRVPVVLSPICWFEPAAIRALAANSIKGGLDLAKWAARRLAPSLPSWRRELLALSSAILPNSEAEAEQLVTLFGVDRSKITVVPNGVQPEFRHASPTLFQNLFGDDDFVLFVGRIEPRKNVLGLIRALRPTGLPLVVLGAAPAIESNYMRACLREGEGFTRMLGQFDHSDPLLASAYAAARVFALPSWFETPGLAALEAGLAGSSVVVTPFGCTREYFGDRVHYARPNRPNEIREAIVSAWNDGPDAQFSDHIASNYPWSRVARITAEVYEHFTA